MLLTLISAALFILAFPLTGHDLSLWPLAFACLSPFFVYLDRAGSLSRQFLAGALFGSCIALGLGYWLFYAMIGEYHTRVVTALLVMIFGVMTPLGLIYGFFGLILGVAGNRGVLFYILLVPSLWVLAEYSREITPLLVPWGLLGYAVQPWNTYIQVADITGVYGLSFLLAMCNGGIAYLCRDMKAADFRRVMMMRGRIAWARRSLSAYRAVFAVLAFILLFPPAYGAVRRFSVRGLVSGEFAAGNGIPVTIAQPNFTQEERWRSTGFMDRVNVCLGLTGRCAPPLSPGVEDGGRADSGSRGLVVWPETVLNSAAMVNGRLFDHLRIRLPGTRHLVAGGLRRAAGTRGVYNTAFLIPGSGEASFYDKNILLPYAETAPFGDILGEYYNAPTEFLKGRTPPAARTDAGIAGLSICFEAVYPSHARRSAVQGARFLVNISNDGWFGATSEPVMHLRQATLRAVENRRFLVRASNNGYSAIVSPAGEAVRLSGLFTRECISGEIVPLERRSWYTLLGDWVVAMSATILACMMGFVLFRK